MIDTLPLRRPYLVIVRAGDRSLHREWPEPAGDRSYDLWISYNGSERRRYAHDGEYYNEDRGNKYPALHELMAAHGERILQYEAVWLPDDDILAGADTVDGMFRLFREQELQLAQPSFTKHAPYPAAARRLDYSLRYTQYVDSRVPLFSREALRACWPTFGRSRSGLGLGHVWAKLLGYPQRGIAILDAAPVLLTRPSGAEADADDDPEQDPGADLAVLDEFGVALQAPGDITHYDGVKVWNPWLATVEKKRRVKRKRAVMKGKRRPFGKRPARRIRRKAVRRGTKPRVAAVRNRRLSAAVPRVRTGRRSSAALLPVAAPRRAPKLRAARRTARLVRQNAAGRRGR